MFIFKNAFHHQYFFSAVMPVRIEISLRRPSNQSGPTALSHQGHDREARHHALVPSGCFRIDDFSLDLIGTKVSQLDKERAARFAEWCMGRSRRIHDVCAGWVISRLITECAIQNQYLFTPFMRVNRKLGSWLVSNDGGCFCHLTALTLQHAPIHPRFGA